MSTPEQLFRDQIRRDFHRIIPDIAQAIGEEPDMDEAVEYTVDYVGDNACIAVSDWMRTKAEAELLTIAREAL